MAVQDEPRADKSEPTGPEKAGLSPELPRAEGQPLSAAAAAAAAKIEATLAASRSAALAGKAQIPPVSAVTGTPVEPVAEPVEHQIPQAAPVAPNAAISAAAAAASVFASTASSPASAAKTPKPSEPQPPTKQPINTSSAPTTKIPAASTPANADEPAAVKAPAKSAAQETGQPAQAKADVKTAATSAAKTAPKKPVAVKTTANPVEKSPASKAVHEPEEIEDIIAMIPVEPEKPVTPSPVKLVAPDEKMANATAEVPAPELAVAPRSNSEMTAAAVAEARNRVFGAYNPGPEPTPAARERREAREAALGAKPPLARTLQSVLAVAYPFVLLILAIRAVASSAFLWAAYQRPGFPADGFGFSTADRLTYGSYGVDYLNNVADSRYLSELRDPSGNPLFLNTEVQHMLDVKNVISMTYASGVILALIMIVILFYLGKSYAGGIRRGLFAGATSTILLFAALTTLAILGWDTFFTSFHNIFFAEGTWTFNYSDTLIRLYPPQFWIDAAITIGAIVILVSVMTMIFTWPTAKRREKSRLRQEARVFGLK